jgi:hypothetical protein
LAPADRPPGIYVQAGSDRLAPTGAFVCAATVLAEWRTACDRLVGEAVRAELERAGAATAPAVADALEVIARDGAVQRGSLVLINDHPPRIGHVMPPHYNVSLNRDVRGDVALTTRLNIGERATAFGDIEVYARSARGTWAPVTLPRGICLGSGVPVARPDLDPSLAALAFLRWAATRIATNGRFHEYDGHYDE